MKLLDLLFGKDLRCSCNLPKDKTKLRLECMDRHPPYDYATAIRAFEHLTCHRLLTSEQAKPLLRIGESQE